MAGDFNGDGAPDVATQVHGNDLRILSGLFGRDGTPAGGVHDVKGPPHNRMGDLATGDVNGDGISDPVSAGDSRRDSSDVAYWKGTHDGHTTGTALGGIHGPQDAGDTVDVGDVNGDGYADVVTDSFFVFVSTNDGGSGVEEAEYARKHHLPHLRSGVAVIYVPGGRSGPHTGRMTMFNQDSPGTPGVAHEDDDDAEEGGTEYFGSGISVGDIDGDGHADVSTGIPAKYLRRPTPHPVRAASSRCWAPRTA